MVHTAAPQPSRMATRSSNTAFPHIRPPFSGLPAGSLFITSFEKCSGKVGRLSSRLRVFSSAAHLRHLLTIHTLEYSVNITCNDLGSLQS